jgi:putative transposase
VSIIQRLYPEPAQHAVMAMHCDHARAVFNLGLEQRSMWRPEHRGRTRINMATQMRELAQARQETDWLRAGSSVVQQGALRDLDRAFTNFFARPGTVGYPKYRKRDHKQSFVIRDLTVHRLNRKWATVTVPKCGKVKFRLTRPFTQVQAATGARVTLSPSGSWSLALTTPPAPFERTNTGASVGIDRGVAQTISTSTGTHETIPGLTPGEQARFLALERQLSRQVKGSNRRNTTKKKLGVLRERLSRRRKNWVEQATTALVRAHDLVAIEKLATANMVRRAKPKPDPENPGAFLPNGAAAKTGLNRAIAASCWGIFAKRLHDKATHSPARARTTVLEVDPAHTSQRCHPCGHIDPKNRKSQAAFECTSCGHTAHADTNAALNILHRAAPPRPQDMRLPDASAIPGPGPGCGVKPAAAPCA